MQVTKHKFPATLKVFLFLNAASLAEKYHIPIF